MARRWTEKEAGRKRPNCPWVAEFKVVGVKKPVSFTVSDEQRDGWLKDPIPESVVANYCRMVRAALHRQQRIDIPRIEKDQIHFVEFRKRDGSISARQLHGEFTADELAKQAREKEARQAEERHRRINRIGEGQNRLFK